MINISMSGLTLWKLPFCWTTMDGVALHKVICWMDIISSRSVQFDIPKSFNCLC